MAYLSVVVPNRLSDGRALPRIKALVEGLKLPQYAADGTFLGKSFTSNPAWVILDILQRCGWDLERIDLRSFAQTASYCDELIEAKDLYGNPVQIPRFQCNLVLRRRASAAEVVRGVRLAARLYLTYNAAGKLELQCENSLALQQPEKPEGSNSREPLNGGWPAYEFGDGTDGYSGILRRDNGEPSLRVWSRPTAETPNRYTVEFQDAFNDYQQDSVSLVDVDDVLRTGQEVCGTLPAMGIANLDQALRIVKFYLDRSVEGNTYIEFETSVKGFGLRPGDIITVTYLKEGFHRTPFRVLKVAPGTNYGRAQITAQLHRDEWYRDDNVARGTGGGTRGSGARGGLPRPLGGIELDEAGMARFSIEERYRESGDGTSELSLVVGFAPPRPPEPSRAERPLISFAVRVEPEGGSLGGGQTLYYAVSGIDGNGVEGPLSFIVPAAIPEGTNTNKVTLTGLRFSPATTGFRVYRGPSPSQLWQITEEEGTAASFSDTGLPNTTVTAPDENYDHANFYWRFELQPEYGANIFGEDRIGNTEARMAADAYQGMVVRITRGKGAGQERAVVANDATTLVVSPRWSVTPDQTSHFVVAEAGWHQGATARTSPVEFVIPNRAGATIHVLGRAANGRGEECAVEISPVTRWRLGTSGTPFDLGPPGRPTFGLSLKGEGIVELVGISFEDLANTKTIQAATLSLYYWDELESPTRFQLVGLVNEGDQEIELSAPGEAQEGSLIQVGDELMRVMAVADGGRRYAVERGWWGSAKRVHEAGSDVYHLKRKVYVAPFVRGFFGSRASGNYAYPIYLPDARIGAAEVFVTNARGNSESAFLCFTNTEDQGLRTLSGGQITLQVEGYLGIQSDAVPPFVVDEAHSVRDIFGVLYEPAEGGAIELRVRQDDAEYCRLRIEEAQTVSNVVNGFGLPPLRAGATLRLDVLAVGLQKPGGNLTVTIRL
ncbi:MAG: phage tail protein [Bryobacteraceae bacterium]